MYLLYTPFTSFSTPRISSIFEQPLTLIKLLKSQISRLGESFKAEFTFVNEHLKFLS